MSRLRWIRRHGHFAVIGFKMLQIAWANGRHQQRRRNIAREILKIWQAAAAALAILSGRRAHRWRVHKVFGIVGKWVADNPYVLLRCMLHSGRRHLLPRAFFDLAYREIFLEWGLHPDRQFYT